MKWMKKLSALSLIMMGIVISTASADESQSSSSCDPYNENAVCL